MTKDLIETGNTRIALGPCPIEPSWITEGNPVATSTTIWRSADGMSSTLVWQCTPGRFDWHYDLDETIHILEGSIVLECETFGPTRYGPGDVVYFKNGAHAKWIVETQVRKLAFCRRTQPMLIGLAVRAVSKARRMLMPGNNSAQGSFGV
jgi:uncharacterized cupin superfamily protein